MATWLTERFRQDFPPPDWDRQHCVRFRLADFLCPVLLEAGDITRHGSDSRFCWSSFRRVDFSILPLPVSFLPPFNFVTFLIDSFDSPTKSISSILLFD
ncbi:unnamed protein product [Linum trigynum]|uniref:Uncharacterized protein n=1 Tax=Linum trigynum TaxID=586398 RepID=A0AAV2DUR9_9ROSI